MANIQASLESIHLRISLNPEALNNRYLKEKKELEDLKIDLAFLNTLRGKNAIHTADAKNKLDEVVMKEKLIKFIIEEKKKINDEITEIDKTLHSNIK